MANSFKVKFDINDYKDIFPDAMEYIKHDQVINADAWEKQDWDNCVWKKHRATQDEINDPAFREREATRVLRTGVWIAIKEEILWIPPNYYFFLQYWTVGGQPPQFRIKRLKHVYFKIRVRRNPKALGTYTIKNRQDGETSIAMSDCMWEAADGNMDFGAIGIQSKTRDTVTQSCWRVFTMGWNGMDSWIKNDLFSDMVSGDKIAEKMKFVTPKEGVSEGRDILVTYGACTHNAFDSMNNMRRCVLDEVNKWEECSFYATFLNYEKFISAGTTRKGVFDIFSSPGDTPGKHNEEAYALWLGSNPDELIDGVTKTKIFRYYSNPLEGIEGMYDKWGDADPDEVFKEIMKKRDSVPKEFLLGEIRANPLDENEMFDSVENGGHEWSNLKGIKERKIFLIGCRFKNDETKEPKVVYGNLERIDGYIDGDVEFRQADIDHFDLKVARWCFSYLPTNKEPLKSVFMPPQYVEGCLGVDPFNNRYPAKHAGKQSNGAMVNRVFRDLHGRGYNKCPTMIYCCRPTHQEVFFQDVIKSAIFNRSLIQYENKSDKLANYAEDHGYFDWLLPEIGATKDSKIKGDAPSGGGRNAFLEEGMGLIDANTNVPLHPSDPYYLEYHWFEQLLQDYIDFNPADTHLNDLSMADIQSLIGSVKILYKKIKKPSPVTGSVISYLMS